MSKENIGKDLERSALDLQRTSTKKQGDMGVLNQKNLNVWEKYTQREVHKSEAAEDSMSTLNSQTTQKSQVPGSLPFFAYMGNDSTSDSAPGSGPVSVLKIDNIAGLSDSSSNISLAIDASDLHVPYETLIGTSNSLARADYDLEKGFFGSSNSIWHKNSSNWDENTNDNSTDFDITSAKDIELSDLTPEGTSYAQNAAGVLNRSCNVVPFFDIHQGTMSDDELKSSQILDFELESLDNQNSAKSTRFQRLVRWLKSVLCDEEIYKDSWVKILHPEYFEEESGAKSSKESQNHKGKHSQFMENNLDMIPDPIIGDGNDTDQIMTYSGTTYLCRS